jgi:hypothetical protein
LTAQFPINRHFAVYRIHFRFARTLVLYIILYIYRTRVYPDTVFRIPFVIHATTILFYKYKIYISDLLPYIQDRYSIDRRVSRLHIFLLTGSLLYTGFTFDSPECPSYIYIIYQLRFVSFAHFLPELISYLSPKRPLIDSKYIQGPTTFFGTIRYMQPVSALSPSFLSSSS